MNTPRPRNPLIVAFLILVCLLLSLAGCDDVVRETPSQASAEVASTGSMSHTPTSASFPNLELIDFQFEVQTGDGCNDDGELAHVVSLEIQNSGDADAGAFQVLLNENTEKRISELRVGESQIIQFSTREVQVRIFLDNRNDISEQNEEDNYFERIITAPSRDVCPSTPEAAPSTTHDLIPRFPPGAEINILEVRMFNGLQGWAIGDWETGVEHILQTRDGGRTWLDVSPPEQLATIESPFLRATPFFLDLENAWIMYQSDPHGQPGSVWRTQDAGHSWELGPERERVIPGSQSSWGKLEFVDENHGWLLIDHYLGGRTYQTELHQTMDGGHTWQLLQSDQATHWITGSTAGIDFFDSKYGMITSSSFATGEVFSYFTRDGGKNWRQHELSSPDTNSDLFNLLPCGIGYPVQSSPETGMLNVYCYNNEGINVSYLYGTQDTGYTWKAYPFPARFRGVAMEVIRPDLIFLLGAYVPDASGDTIVETAELYRTMDQGKSWEQMAIVNWFGRIYFTNDQVGWAIARFDYGNSLYSTTDGGLTWEHLNPSTVSNEGE